MTQQYVSQGAVPVGSEFRVNTYTAGSEHSQVIASLADGGFVLTWVSSAGDGSDFGIYGQVYNSDGSAQGGEFRVNTYTVGSQSDPRVTSLSNGRFVVAWTSGGQDGSDFGIYGQVYNSDGSAQGGEFRVNTYTVGNQLDPHVTSLADGGFAVTWNSDGQDGSLYGIYGQVYNSDGSAQGGEFRVNTYTEGGQSDFDVAGLASGGFVVTWTTDIQDGSSLGVYGQAYNSNGSPLGSEFRVNTYIDGAQCGPKVISLIDGGFAVTWTSDDQDGLGLGVYGQVYNGEGISVGAEFRVNTSTTGEQSVSSITSLADGGFVVTWKTVGQDGSEALYGQVYSVSGIPVGDEFRVSNYTTAEQITKLANGGFVVTWSSPSQDDPNWGVYCKAYNSDGTPAGSEFHVNTYTTDFQGVSSIASLADGGFLVAWRSYGQDGFAYGVYGQLFRVGNASPMGFLEVSGTAAQGHLLSANAAGVTDLDGIDLSTAAYQWLRDGNVIADATNSAYTLSAADIGFAISVRYSYTDNFGTNEIVTSAATALVQRTVFNGGYGADALTGNAFDNYLYGFAGDDSLYGGDGDDTLDGGAGNDVLAGGAGDDSLRGGLGNDRFTVASGTDSIADLGGSDILTVAAGAAASATVTAAWTATSATTNAGTATLTTNGYAVNLAAVTGGSAGFSVTNTGAAATLTGSKWADTLAGGTGKDILVGGLGNDSLTGGAGNDTFRVASGTDSIRDLGAGDILTVASGSTALAAVTAAWTATSGTANAGTATLTTNGFAVNLGAVTGGSRGYSVTNTGAAATLTGSKFADTLTGGTGADTLAGGAGVDTLLGGDGNDLFVASLASDLATGEVITGGSGTDELRFTSTTASTLTLTAGVSVERVVIGTGTVGPAVSTGTTAINVNAAAVTVGLTIVGNAGANTLTGGAGADSLEGGSGIDKLIGGAGADTLAGGLGNDSLTGGLGADVFVFNTAPNVTNNKDVITDFNATDDAIWLAKSVMTGLGGASGALGIDAFWGGTGITASHDASDRVIYNQTTGALYYDADGNGSTAALQIAQLTAGTLLTASDVFIF